TINGYTIMKFNIPPMIMTLGMMYMARGAVFISTKGWPIYPIPLAFQKIEQSEILGVPTIIPICLVLCVIFQFLLTRTTFGRSIYALGGNKDAAKLSGINVKKIQVLVFSISGLMATFTGIMMAARLGSAQPSSGEGNEMNVIAACIIGGTSTFGGRGTVLGTAIGALFMSMLSNSMTLMKVDIYYQKLVIGAVLVIAVILDQYKRDMAQSKSLKKS
ncbi:MAG: ABC transporter permease, partial [Oscillospiraceae bacterium]